MKRRLIGSTGSLEQMIELLKNYFHSPNIRLEQNISSYTVHNSKGVIEGCLVIEKKGRFRFEMEIE